MVDSILEDYMKSNIVSRYRFAARLTSRKAKNRRGVTLIELAIVLLVLGVIMAIVLANVDFGVADDAMKLQLKSHSNMVPLNLQKYEMLGASLEDGDSLMILTQKSEENPSFRPVKKDAILDPWKRPYFICYDENSDRQICSYGADGEPGGEGKNADIYLTNDSSWPDWLLDGQPKDFN